MTAGWTDTSITVNTMPVHRRAPLRLRPIRRRLVAANADSWDFPKASALGTSSIGEVVIHSRSSCTGHWPVHSFRKLSGLAASLVLAAAPLSFVSAPPAVAATVAVPSGQSVDDFYRLRKDAPLWLSPT